MWCMIIHILAGTGDVVYGIYTCLLALVMWCMVFTGTGDVVYDTYWHWLWVWYVNT